jgi:hypothetical protein
VAQTSKIVKQRSDARDVLVEGIGIDLGYVGEGDWRNVACRRRTVGRGSRSGRSQEAGADNRGLQESRDGCSRVRRVIRTRSEGSGVSAPFWPASLSELFGLAACVSRAPPMELTDRVLSLDKRREGRLW